MMKSRILVIAVGLSALIVLKSCVNHDLSEITEVANTDESLFKEIKEAGYEYYQSGDLLSPADPSPHGSFRLRFNPTAIFSLDNTGELPVNGAFQAGAVIVKEIYDASDVLILYAVIKKAPGDASAKDGRLWAEYALDGTAIVSIQEKGSGCVDCHSGTPNRDLFRTFDLH